MATCDRSEVVVGVAYMYPRQTFAGRSKTVVIKPSHSGSPHRGPITPDSSIIITPHPCITVILRTCVSIITDIPFLLEDYVASWVRTSPADR
jgi:hypothetical protein